MPAGFSLSALEQLLAENQRLVAVEAQAAGQAAFTAQLRDLQVRLWKPTRDSARHQWPAWVSVLH